MDTHTYFAGYGFRAVVIALCLQHSAVHCQVPTITGIIPSYGPVSGSTKIFIHGDNFVNATNGVIIAFRHSGTEFSCGAIRIVNATLLVCLTSALSHEMDTLVNQPLDLVLNTVTVPRVTFTYRPDPVITSITPNESFLRGGIIQTVMGRHFDSVHWPKMHVYTFYENVLHEPPYPVEHLPSLCTVDSSNSSIMRCTAPAILDRERIVVSPDGHSAQLNNDYRKFFLSFSLDGVLTYTIGNLSDISGDHLQITMYHDPKVDPWEDDPLILKTYKEDNFIHITGQRLDYAAQMSDYKINISDTECTVIELNSNKISCEAPPRSPQENVFSTNGEHRVVLNVGFLTVQVGYLLYHHTIWDDPQFRIGIIATAVVVGSIVLILSITCIVLKCKYKDPIAHLKNRFNRRRTKHTTNVYSERPVNILDRLQSDLKAKVIECLIEPPTRMRLGHEVGNGNFGKVYSGLLTSPQHDQPQDCAIKTLKDDWNDEKNLREFLEEAIIMKDFRHDHVLTLLGVVILNGTPHVLLPFMLYGDLKGYVKNPRRTFFLDELLGYGLQVAKGMEYLAANRFVHRDLAARNCMVDDRKIVKIADFGLARDMHERDYYKVEDKNRPMPYKWMAPECLNTFKFDSRSDVWSYGVTVWEVMRRGLQPYIGIDNLDLRRYLLRGGRLPRPPQCPDQVHELLLNCWHIEPDKRLTFSAIASRLSHILEESKKVQDNNNAGIMRGTNTLGNRRGYISLAIEMPSSEPAYVGEGHYEDEADNRRGGGENRRVERYSADPLAQGESGGAGYLKPVKEYDVKDAAEGYSRAPQGTEPSYLAPLSPDAINHAAAGEYIEMHQNGNHNVPMNADLKQEFRAPSTQEHYVDAFSDPNADIRHTYLKPFQSGIGNKANGLQGNNAAITAEKVGLKQKVGPITSDYINNGLDSNSANGYIRPVGDNQSRYENMEMTGKQLC